MRRLSDRLGKLDDRSVIYRTDDPEQRVHWRRAGGAYVGGTALFVVLSAVLRSFVSQDVALAIVFAAAVAFLIVYVIWRRRRNKRLTGSPTSWPDP
jgi:uncharacterized membrane protein YfcA